MIIRGETDKVRNLLAAGLCADDRDQRGQTMMHLACTFGRLDVVDLLSNHGSINMCDNDGVSPIDLAAENGHLDIVKFLITRGADLTHVSSGGYTVLHRAAFGCDMNVYNYLVEQGLDPDQPDHFNRSPSHWLQQRAPFASE